MTDKSIALNRFGYGARPGEDPGADPKQWLLRQLDHYVAQPPVIAALPGSSATVVQLLEYRAQAEALRKAAASAAVAAKPAQPTQPAMSPGAPAAPASAGAVPMATAPTQPPPPPANGSEAAETLRKQISKQVSDGHSQAVTARAVAAIDSPAPFAERLVHFWANHFAISADKMELIALAGTLEFEAIRPNLMGSFRDMLFAVERHPAMLLYLDQSVSVGPNSPLASRQRPNQRRSLGLNENLAREIMELHTLGVRSGYTQADVTEFARAMTGWTIAGFGRGPLGKWTPADGAPGQFVFGAEMHEPGTRTILGKKWPQPGETQASAVLATLAAHPATARHIATKLARHFAGDDPPPRLVARLESSFLKTGGDLPSLYRTLVASPECWAPAPVKFKSPWEWTVSALRVLDAQQLPLNFVPGMMVQLGQPVWKPGSPAGWDDIAPAWAAPDAVLRRVEAAQRIAQRARDVVDPRQRAELIFPASLSQSTEQAIARAESPAQGVALMLVSPEFLRR